MITHMDSLCKSWELALSQVVVIGDWMTDASYCAYQSSWSCLIILVVLSHSLYLAYYIVISHTCTSSIKEVHCCP